MSFFQTYFENSSSRLVFYTPDVGSCIDGNSNQRSVAPRARDKESGRGMTSSRQQSKRADTEKSCETDSSLVSLFWASHVRTRSRELSPCTSVKVGSAPLANSASTIASPPLLHAFQRDYKQKGRDLNSSCSQAHISAVS